MTRRENGRGSVARHANERGVWVGYVRTGEYTAGGRERRKYVYARTRVECRERVEGCLREIEEGISVTTGRATLGDYLQVWLRDSAAQRLRPNTLSLYEYHIRCNIVPRIGRIPLGKLTPAHVQGMMREQRAAGQKANTIHSTRSVLSSALQTALLWQLCKRNVARLTEPVRADPPVRRALTVTEATRFLENEHVRDHRLYAFFLLSILHGLRRGETCALRWEDVDLDRGTVRIRQSVNRVGGKLLFSTPKTKSSLRMVYLSNTAAQALKRHRDLQTFERAVAGERWIESGLVFVTRWGTVIEPSGVNRTLRELTKKLGIPHIRVHDLRHTAASIKHELGVDLKDISEELGHARISTTADMYIEVFDTGRRRTAERMDELFASDPPPEQEQQG